MAESDENRRKGEANGPKLAPSERLLNVAKAIAIIVPLFGAGWFANTEAVKGWYAEPPQVERDEPVAMDCPDVSCPTCPEINLNEIGRILKQQCSLSNHEEKYHQ